MGIKAILQELRIKLPETKILMLAIFPRGKNDDQVDSTSQALKWMEQTGARQYAGKIKRTI